MFMIKMNATEELQVSIHCYLKILQIWWTNMNFDIAELYCKESIFMPPNEGVYL